MYETIEEFCDNCLLILVLVGVGGPKQRLEGHQQLVRESETYRDEGPQEEEKSPIHVA